jgi:hypothetical protein
MPAEPAVLEAVGVGGLVLLLSAAGESQRQRQIAASVGIGPQDFSDSSAWTPSLVAAAFRVHDQVTKRLSLATRTARCMPGSLIRYS